MKLLYSLFCLFCLSFFIISCQQEPDDDFPNPNSTGDSTVLARFVLLDTTQPVGSDTIISWRYSYDNRKRLSKLVIYGIDPTSSATQTITTNFWYNGTDTLPYRTTGYTEDSFNKSWDTVYYTYQNEIIIADSIRGRSLNLLGPVEQYGVSVDKYTIVSPTRVTLHHKSESVTASGSPLGSLCESDYTYTKAFTFGNITRQDETSSGCFPAGLTTFTELTYDNHPNPFNKLELPYPVLRDNTWMVTYPYLSQKNNTATIDNTTVLSYVYNSLGYPVILRSSDITDPTFFAKGVYFYTK